MSVAPHCSFSPIALLPRERQQDGPLLFVMSIMALLAGLIILFATMSTRAIDQWQSGLTQGATLTLKLSDIEQRETQTAQLQAILETRGDIKSISVLSEARAKALLKPWLGDVELPDDLPVPALFSLELAPDKRLDVETLRSEISEQGLDVVIDDHSLWRIDIERNRKTLLGALRTILVLILLSSMAVSIFATQARLHTQHKTISVLHQVGAKNSFIARLFVGQFFLRGLIAGAIGCSLALLFALIFQWVQGDNTVFGQYYIIGSDIIKLVYLALIFGLICALTAGLTGLSVLNRQNLIY